MRITMFLFFALLCRAAAAAPGPNVVLIIADDLGYGDLSCYGAERIKTPAIDSLAAEGVRFLNGYAPNATCTPSRYAMFTGRYAWREARKTSILPGDAPLCISVEDFTLPKMMRRAGYKTAAVGKWHLGLGDGVTPVDFNGEIGPGPLDVGFDYCHIIPATVDRVPTVWVENRRVKNLDPSDPIRVSYEGKIGEEPTGLERPDLLKQKADKQHSCTIINGISRIGYMSGGKSARFTDEDLPFDVVNASAKFIEENREKPFFLYVGLFEPHVPRTVAKRFEGASECGLRGDTVVQADWQVSQIVEALKKNGVYENTIIIFSSDNGPIFFDGYYDNSVEDSAGHRPAGELRGFKYMSYEGGTRVPFIVRWPAKFPARAAKGMVMLNDIYATLADLLGEKLTPPAQAPDSVSFLAELKGGKESARKFGVIQNALRMGDWKYIPKKGAGKVKKQEVGGANPDDPRFAAADAGEQLYKLSQDPGEKNNLAATHPEKAAELRKLLMEIKKSK